MLRTFDFPRFLAFFILEKNIMKERIHNKNDNNRYYFDYVTNCHIEVGEKTEIRYSISEKGELSLESEAFLYWMKELVIGYTLGFGLGIALGVAKLKGIID